MIASKDEMSGWRAHPVTEKVREIMQQRITGYLHTAARFQNAGETVKAGKASLAWDIYQEFYDDLFTDAPEQPSTDEPDDFVDPAALPPKEAA